MSPDRWDTGLRFDSRPSGWRGVVARVFGDGDNPLTWGVPLYTLWGIRVRIHLLFLVYIAMELAFSLVRDRMGIAFVAPIIVSLWVLVLLHEYGHCFVCRMVGGEADEILLWPLGGLASCRPPHHWKADLLTTLGGPAVNAALLPPLALITYIATGTSDSILFNPFTPHVPLGNPDIGGWWVTRSLWSLYYVNAILLAFNMLVPMFPMDAGRVVQALVWRRQGHRRSMLVASTVGLAVAGVLVVVGLVGHSTTLVVLAFLCGATCYFERKRSLLLATGFEEAYAPPQAEPGRARERREAREAAEREEIDRILDKISAHGLHSLTTKEKRVLKRASGAGRGA